MHIVWAHVIFALINIFKNGFLQTTRNIFTKKFKTTLNQYWKVNFWPMLSWRTTVQFARLSIYNGGLTFYLGSNSKISSFPGFSSTLNHFDQKMCIPIKCVTIIKTSNQVCFSFETFTTCIHRVKNTALTSYHQESFQKRELYSIQYLWNICFPRFGLLR